MTKRRSTRLFILFAVVTAILILFTFFNFPIFFQIGGVNYNYNSVVSRLNYSLDISKGVAIDYDLELYAGDGEENRSNYLEESISKLQSALNVMRYYDSTVTKVGDSKLRMEISNANTDEKISIASSLFSEPSLLKLKASTSDEEAYIDGRDVKKIEIADKSTYAVYGIIITFNDDVKSILAEKTASATADSEVKIYIEYGQYVGSNAIQYPVNNPINNGQIGLYSESFISKSSVEQLEAQLLVSTLPFEVSDAQSYKISAGLGFNVGTFVALAIAIAVVLVITWLILKYRELGLIMSFTFVISILLSVLLILTIPFMRINIFGIIGMVFGFAMLLNCLLSALENIKAQYATGKKLNACYRLGYRNTLFSNLTSNLLLFGAAGLLCLMPIFAVKSFGMVLLAISPVSLFSTLLVSKLFLKLYEPLNHSKPKKVNFADVEVNNNAQ